MLSQINVFCCCCCLVFVAIFFVYILAITQILIFEQPNDSKRGIVLKGCNFLPVKVGFWKLCMCLDPGNYYSPTTPWNRGLFCLRAYIRTKFSFFFCTHDFKLWLIKRFFWTAIIWNRYFLNFHFSKKRMVFPDHKNLNDAEMWLFWVGVYWRKGLSQG